MVIGEVVDVALVPLCELHDLQLGEQELRQRDRERLLFQAVGDRDLVAHREVADENVELAGIGLVVEEQPPGSVPDRAGQDRPLGGRLQVDRGSAEQSRDDVPAGENVDQPPRLGDRVREGLVIPL